MSPESVCFILLIHSNLSEQLALGVNITHKYEIVTNLPATFGRERKEEVLYFLKVGERGCKTNKKTHTYYTNSFSTLLNLQNNLMGKV